MPKEWKLCVRLKINRRMTVRVTDKKSNKSVIPGSIFAHVTKDYGTLEVHLRHFLLWRNMISDLIIHSFFSLFPFINECFLCFFLLSDASITDKCIKPIWASTKFHSILHRRCCSLLFLLFRFEGGGMRLKKNNQYLHGVWTSSVSSSHRTLGTALLGTPRPRQATPTQGHAHAPAVPLSRNTLQVHKGDACTHQVETQANKAFSRYYSKHVTFFIWLLEDSPRPILWTQK